MRSNLKLCHFIIAVKIALEILKGIPLIFTRLLLEKDFRTIQEYSFSGKAF